MKIKFKISDNELRVWIACLELCWMEPKRDSPAIVRMAYHGLSNLFHKLRSEALIQKAEYRFSLDSMEALAFVAHMQGYTNYLVNPTDAAIINGIIGIIDHKTT